MSSISSDIQFNETADGVISEDNLRWWARDSVTQLSVLLLYLPISYLASVYIFQIILVFHASDWDLRHFFDNEPELARSWTTWLTSFSEYPVN